MWFLLDPPRINPDDLAEFREPVMIKTGKDAVFEISFVGREPMKIQWFNEGEELFEDVHIRIQKSSSHSRLVLTKCQRKITGEIKIRIKNDCGAIEAITQFVILGTVGTLLVFSCTKAIYKITEVEMSVFVIFRLPQR